VPRILDLCSGSGNWSEPYRLAGYEVIRIDLPADVRLIQFDPQPVHGILAAPPCTYFAGAGQWVRRTDDEYKYALSLVDACLRAVVIYRPSWWALENPVGILKALVRASQMLV
jgi:site-specific DNA-cytosine methylase